MTSSSLPSNSAEDSSNPSGPQPNPMYPDDIMSLPDYREPFPLPVPNMQHGTRPERLNVYHPKLDYGPMLSFIRGSNGGIIFDLVYYSCCVIAGNCWPATEPERGACPEIREAVPEIREAVPEPREETPSGGVIRTPSRTQASGTQIRHTPYPSVPSPNTTRTRRNDSSSTTITQQDASSNTTGASYPYLSKSQNPTENDKIIPYGDMIYEKVLYFHVPKDFLGIKHHPEYGYPITPNFENWIFPHGRVPKLWMDLPPRKDFAPPEDTQCHLTGSLEHVEVAHMVPRAAKVWWDNNHMSDVDDMSDDPTIDCDKNVFGLRKEVHKTFDESTVIPFPRRLGTSGSVLLAFVQKRPSKNVAGLGWELIANYQHRRYRDFDWICKEFIFARFAWSKFCTAHFPILDPTNSKLRDRSVYLATRSPFGGVEYREWHISDRNFPRPRPGHGSTSGQKADKKAGGNQDDDREFEDDCVAEEVDEYYKRTRGLSLPSDEESDYSQGGSSTSGVKRRSPSTSDIDIEDEEPRGRPPKRTRQLVGSVATHQVGWARGLSSPSPNSSAAGDVPDLSASCSSYEGSLMSKGSKSSNGTKPSMTSISTDDGKSGMSKATQGRGGTMSVVVSGDSKNTSDTTHYYAHHEPIA